MREVIITIDEETGEMEVHIQGIPGRSCEEVVKRLKALLGPAASERQTSEWYAQTQMNPTVLNKGGR